MMNNNRTITAARVILSTLIIVVLLTFFCICAWYEDHYYREATVTSISGSTVTVVDQGGNEWVFTGSGFQANDKVRLTMTTMHTDTNIYDDEIVNAKVID